MKKKLTALFLAVVMCMSMSVPAFAEESSLLDSLANKIIQRDVCSDSSDTILVTYHDLKNFVEEVHISAPDLDDCEIANFILDYTGQDPEIIPDDKKLEILGYDNITVCVSDYTIDSDGGVSPCDSQVFENNYGEVMQIVTTYALQDTIDGEDYYDVWATARWFLIPTMFYEECFTIAGTAEFDSDVDEVGYFSETTICAACGKKFSSKHEVDKTDYIGDHIRFKYNEMFPAIYFTPTIPTCSSSCDSGFTRQSLSAYISFGVIANGSKTIQAGYGHKQASVGSLTLSIDNKGTPSFSAGVGFDVESYIARAVTLK